MPDILNKEGDEIVALFGHIVEVYEVTYFLYDFQQPISPLLQILPAFSNVIISIVLVVGLLDDCFDEGHEYLRVAPVYYDLPPYFALLSFQDIKHLLQDWAHIVVEALVAVGLSGYFGETFGAGVGQEGHYFSDNFQFLSNGESQLDNVSEIGYGDGDEIFTKVVLHLTGHSSRIPVLFAPIEQL